MDAQSEKEPPRQGRTLHVPALHPQVRALPQPGHEGRLHVSRVSPEGLPGKVRLLPLRGGDVRGSRTGSCGNLLPRIQLGRARPDKRQGQECRGLEAEPQPEAYLPLYARPRLQGKVRLPASLSQVEPSPVLKEGGASRRLSGKPGRMAGSRVRCLQHGARRPEQKGRHHSPGHRQSRGPPLSGRRRRRPEPDKRLLLHGKRAGKGKLRQHPVRHRRVHVAAGHGH